MIFNEKNSLQMDPLCSTSLYFATGKPEEFSWFLAICSSSMNFPNSHGMQAQEGDFLYAAVQEHLYSAAAIRAVKSTLVIKSDFEPCARNRAIFVYFTMKDLCRWTGVRKWNVSDWSRRTVLDFLQLLMDEQQDMLLPDAPYKNWYFVNRFLSLGFKSTLTTRSEMPDV